MWHEKFTNKHGEVQYRYYEKYKDPLTNKWRRTSVVLNKNGKQSQKEAQKRLNERIEAKLNDKTPTNLKTLTFHAACDEWFESYKLVSGAKFSTIQTKESSINVIKKYIADDVLIKSITHIYLQNVINEWSKVYRRKHVLKLFVVIRSMYKYLAKRYDMDIALLSKVEIPKQAETLEEIESKRNNYLDNDEITEIMGIFDNLIETGTRHSKYRYERVKKIVQFQINNGMRIGELLAIKTSDIDFDNKTLSITGTINWKKDENTGLYGVKDTTKTSQSYRKIGLTQDSINILRSLILENKKNAKWKDNYNDRGFVFTNTAGSPLIKTNINEMLSEVVEMSSITKKVTTHTLRHTHISILAQLGINLKAIQERVGHTDYKTTLDIYTHVTDKMAQDMMNKLENFKIS